MGFNSVTEWTDSREVCWQIKKRELHEEKWCRYKGERIKTLIRYSCRNVRGSVKKTYKINENRTFPIKMQTESLCPRSADWCCQNKTGIYHHWVYTKQITGRWNQMTHAEILAPLQQNTSRHHRNTASEEFLPPAGADRTNTASAQGPTVSIRGGTQRN